MIKTKEKLYLEHSVISAYFDYWETSAVQKRITRKFWQSELPKYQPYISDVTLGEIEDAPEKLKQKLIRLTKGFMVLKLNQKIQNLSRLYITEKIIPQNKPDDALHLAAASIYKMTYLVSWNQRHLVRPYKRKQIFELNQRLKIYTPIIANPQHFIEE